MTNRFVATIVLSVSAAAASAQDCNFREPEASGAKVQALGQEAARSNPCATVPGLTAKSLATVWASFVASGKIGGKRFDTAPPPGSPMGKVLASAEGVPFDLGPVTTEGVLNLTVTSKGAPLFNVVSPKQATVFVPADRLVPGNIYDWQLKTRANSYRGSFETASGEEVAQVQARLASVEKVQQSPSLRLLYAAAIYDDAELYVARDRALAQLRILTSP